MNRKCDRLRYDIIAPVRSFNSIIELVANVIPLLARN
jgi:hypothetical protein